jgi:hypothetical protein
MNSRDKRKTFDMFYKKSKPWFRFIHSKDKPIQNLSNYYGFIICPGSRDGGCNKRIVEVFWGNRPFDKTVKIKGFSMLDEFLTETGATLQYLLLDNGNVVISLSPAKTENLSPIEETIFISLLRNPKKLLKLNYLKRHWSYVKAYMNITSLEGNKNIKNKIITWYLRNFKITISNKQQKEPKIFIVIKSILKFVATVGLSGFLLIAIMSIKECKSNEENKILNLQIIENLKQVKSSQTDILMDLNNINNKIYDINIKMIDIYKKDEP